MGREEAVILSRPDDRQSQISASQPPNKHTWRLALTVILAVIGVIGAFAVGFPTQLKHQLAISIVRQPTPYTQLFFSDPAALPKELKTDRTNKFAFTLINDEGRPETYDYIVTMTGAKSSEVVGMGSLTVRNNGQFTKTVGIKPKNKKTRYLIKVTLSDSVDFIQFYGITS